MKKYKVIIIVLLFCMLFATVVQASTGEIATTETEVAIVKELTELRELTSKTYELSDGTYKYVGYTDDIHYTDESGKLVDIDTSFISSDKKVDGVSCKYENSANSFDVLISDMSDTKYPVTMIQGEYSVSFGINNPKEVSSSICESFKSDILSDFLDAKSSVIFSNVIDDVDLIYESSTHGVKEYIVLNSTPSTNTFEFIVKTTGLELTKAETSTIEFVNSKGESIFTVGNLFAIDDNEELTEKVTCDFSEIDGGYLLQIAVDEQYLNDSSRAYPVIIDPSVTISSSSTMDSFVGSKSPNTNYNSGSNMNYLRTGRDSYYYTRRSYIKFAIPTSIPVNSVTSAYVNLRRSSGATPDMHAYMVNGDWYSNTITWSNKPNYITSSYVSGDSFNFTQYGSSSWYRMNVTSMVCRWVNGTSLNYGMCIRDDTESGTSQWTTFYSSDASSPNKPELDIYYSTTSGTDITSVSPSTGYMLQNESYLIKAYVSNSINPTVQIWDIKSSGANRLLGTLTDAGSYYYINLTPKSPYDGVFHNDIYWARTRITADDGNTNDTYTLYSLYTCSKEKTWYESVDSTFYHNSLNNNSFRAGRTVEYNCLAYVIGVNDSWEWEWSTNPTETELDNYMEKQSPYTSRPGTVFAVTTSTGYPKVIYYTDGDFQNGTGEDGHFAKVMSWNSDGSAAALYSKWSAKELIYSVGEEPFIDLFGSTAVAWYN